MPIFQCWHYPHWCELVLPPVETFFQAQELFQSWNCTQKDHSWSQSYPTRPLLASLPPRLWTPDPPPSIGYTFIARDTWIHQESSRAGENAAYQTHDHNRDYRYSNSRTLRLLSLQWASPQPCTRTLLERSSIFMSGQRRNPPSSRYYNMTIRKTTVRRTESTLHTGPSRKKNCGSNWCDLMPTQCSI